VEDPLDALHRTAHRPAIEDVPAEHSSIQLGDAIDRGLAAHEQTKLIASPREQPRDVRSDEPGGTGDQRYPHVPGECSDATAGPLGAPPSLGDTVAFR
jgi:hypothetical protein